MPEENVHTADKLAYNMPADGYPDHPIAAIFPMMEGAELKELADDIADNGLQEDVVLHANDTGTQCVLDGRNRQKGCLMRSVTPRFRLFGSRTSDGTSAVAFVLSHNIPRRHLSPSQKAVVANEMKQLFAAEAKARQQAHQFGQPATEQASATTEDTARLNSGAPDKTNGAATGTATETVLDMGPEFAQAPARKKRGAAKDKSAAKAAHVMGVSTDSVEKAAKLQQEDPKAYEDVKQGTQTLNAALTGKPTAGTKAAEDYDKALARIEKVCGANQAKAIRDGAILRNRKDVIAYAALDDKKMLAIRSLIDQGWPVKKATHWKAEDILPTHTVRAAIERAAAEGGEYQQKVHIENMGIVAMVTVKIMKGEAMQTRHKAAAKKAGTKKAAKGKSK